MLYLTSCASCETDAHWPRPQTEEQVWVQRYRPAFQGHAGIGDVGEGGHVRGSTISAEGRGGGRNFSPLGVGGWGEVRVRNGTSANAFLDSHIPLRQVGDRLGDGELKPKK